MSELYYPELTSTGLYMTCIAEALAAHMTVCVLCSQPTYSSRGQRAQTDEVREGVSIHRCWSTTFSKDRVTSRIANMVTFSVSVLFEGLRRFRKGDVALVVTNPPVLPFIVGLAAAVRGAQIVLKIDDVYPDILFATGFTRSTSRLAKLLRWASRRILLRCEKVVVIGRDMAERVRERVGGDAARPSVVVITSWADVDVVRAVPKGQCGLWPELKGKFIVLHAGNLGRAQDLETVLRAAQALGAEEDVVFVMVGSGGREAWLAAEVRGRGLRNVIIKGPLPRDRQTDFLSACDVALTVLVPGMLGVSVPSRLYNYLAAGRPVIVVGDHGSEACLTVEEEQVGWFVGAGDWQGLADAVRSARGNPVAVREMGRRAREVAEARFSREVVLRQYERLLNSVIGSAG
ncbi:MAG: glycosyltransferase family 4 protein [Actinomycetota bacterium]|nr:glycosyltransferase family 4 protein [Actinomycetota bacterium]